MEPQAREAVSFGPFRLLADARSLERQGRPVELGSRALDLLIALVERAGAVVPKRELMARAWPDLTVDEGNLRSQMVLLRKVLGDGVDGTRYIRNIPSRGYCFVAPTSVTARPLPGPGQSPARLPHQQGPLPPARNMLGRDDFLKKVTLQLHAYRFVTIHGPGGVGKTTVATAIAHAEAGAFGENVLFLDLATIQDSSLVVGALASALGLSVDTSDPAPAILAMLKDTRALIVLDSCEHVVEQVAVLGERLYRAAPRVSLLATSREPLRAAGERVIAVPPLDLPSSDEAFSIEKVLRSSAAQLFLERATAAGLGPTLTASDAARLVQLCHALDGLPLAIEIAASRAGRHGLVETAELLDGRFQLSWRGLRSARPRHQTLEATLAWSFDLLSRDEQVALQRLSVLAGRFNLEDARAIAQDEADGEGAVEAILDNLVAKSMVSVDLVDGPARYRLLDTTRAYVQAKLAEGGDAPATALRHARYIADKLSSRDLSEELAATTDLLGDVRVALSWAFSQDGERALALRLAAASAPFLIQRSLFAECGRWVERARAALGEAERGGLVEMKLDAAYGTILILMQSNGAEAQAAIERALAVATRHGDLHTQFQLLYRLQLLHRRTGAFHHLLPLAEQLQRLAGKIGVSHYATSALLMVASSHALTGDQRLAHALFEQSIRSQLTSPPVSPTHFAYVGSPQIGFSLTLWLRGLPDQAARAAHMASAESPSVLFSCMGLAWGAVVFREVGDHGATEQLATRLREKARRHSLAPYQAVGMAFAGDALLARGEHGEAVAHLKDAVELLRAREYGLYVSIFARSLARALTETGRIEEARRTAQGQIDDLESVGGSYDLPEWLRIRGEIEARTGDVEAAEATFRASIRLARQQSALSWRLRAETSLARFLLDQGREKEAGAGLAATLALFEEGFTTCDLASAGNLIERIGQARS